MLSPKKTALILILLTALITGALYYFYIAWLGWPDGHLTEAERATKQIYYTTLWYPFLVVVSLGLVVEKTSTHFIKRFNWIALALILIYLGFFFQRIYTYYSQLDTGHGG